MDGQLAAGDALLKRLLAVIVNHRSGAFCERCVESLRRTWLLEGGDPADLTVVVVDTASGPAEEPWLSSIEKDGSQIVRCEKNLGYAGGMIAGYRQALKDECATDGCTTSGLAVRSLRETEELLAQGEVDMPFELEELGLQEGAFSVSFDSEEEVLFELSACPFFSLAAGALTSGETWELREALWSWIFPGKWYLRAACALTGRHLGAWSFEKETAARVEPVELGCADREVHAIESMRVERRAA